MGPSGPERSKRRARQTYTRQPIWTTGDSNMAEAAVSANRLELLQIADAVAREKSIDKSVVLAAMAEAIQRAAKSRYGAENDIRAEIDPRTGETRLNRLLLVVEKVENEATEI